jgi:D-alanyl-D-alanine carboxypeptidase/D-alanyl-D-alanine-endopeptidase (penicillin-binding protein 4)
MLHLRGLAALFLAAASFAAQSQPLPAEVESALVQSKLPRDAVTLLVAPAEGGAPRVAHRAEVPVNPASIAKLVTTFAALDTLGPAFTWSTPVYLDGPVKDGTLQGNLVIQGRGDPKLVSERIWLLLRRVQGLGVRRIAGDIVLDRSAFEVPPQDPGAFDGEPLRPYNAAPDALLLNFRSLLITFTPQGETARVHVEPPLAPLQAPATVPIAPGPCNDWRGALKADFSDPSRLRFQGALPAACGEVVWPVASTDPQGYAARAIAGMWQQLGGQLTGQVRDGRAPAGLKPAFGWTSPPLAEIVRDVNKFSNNVMAQQLWLTLGLQQRGTGSFDTGREAMRAWWRDRIGGEPPAIENGSGLSRGDRITARQLAQVLQAAWASPVMSELMSSLPVSGTDGTLRRAQRIVGLAHLKTGSLRDVAGVAGYVDGANGRRWVLVAIANHPNAAAVRPVADALVSWAAAQ